MTGSLTATLPAFTAVEEVGDRRLSKRFLLTDTAQENKYGENETAALDIVVSHNRDSKRYEVRFYRVIVSKNFVRWAMELRNEDPQPVRDYVVEYAPRYSAKRLREIYATVIGGMDADGTPLPDLLDWASRAKR